MPDTLDFLDALFDDRHHDSAVFEDGIVLDVAHFEDVADVGTVSGNTPRGQAFVFGVMDDVEDDAYLGCKIKPNAVLYRDGQMIVCWTLDKPYKAADVAPLAEALGMEDVHENVPLPLPTNGWRCLLADPKPSASLEEMMRVYGTPQKPAGRAEPAPWEDDTYGDARVMGGFDPQSPDLDEQIVISFGRDRESTKWKPQKLTRGAFLGMLAQHKEGTKDGISFVLGDMVPGRRLKTSIKALWAVGLDIDVGTPTAVVDAAVAKLGCLAIRYSTHSHLNAKTTFKKDMLIKWADKNADGAEIDDELVQAYLTEKGWDPTVVKSIEYVGDEHDEKGIQAVVKHIPMPKHRIVVPFVKPFVIADQGSTQADAMKRWGKVPTALAAELGLPLDESCLDPSRLFYLPRHTKGRPFDAAIFGGGLFDWKSLELDNAWADIAEKMGKGSGGKSSTDKGRELGRWSMKAAHGFLLCQAIEDFAPDKMRHQTSQGWECECPFDDGHSNAGDPEDRGFMAVSAGDGPSEFFMAKCQHESCKGYTNLDMLGRMIEDGWFTADILTDPTYNAADVSEAPNPEIAERIDREDKATAAYLSEIAKLTSESSEEQVQAAIRTALEAQVGVVEREKIPNILKDKIGMPIASVRKIIKAVQAEMIEESRDDSGITDPHGRKVFTFSAEFNFDEAYNACFRALLADNKKYGEPVFSCVQDQPVRLNRNKTGRISFDEIGARTMWSELNTRVTFIRQNDQGGAGARAQVPIDVANHCFEQAYTKLPQAPEIVYTPLFIPHATKGGALISEPGWYEEPVDLIMADTGFVVPPVEKDPTHDEVDDALYLLEEDVLGDFPFLDFDTQGVERRAPSLANALAMLITPFMRRLLTSPTPVFFISKPIPGTGGTLLGMVPILLYDGEEPTPEPYTQNEEEMRKTLLASIMTTRSHLFYDDVREFNNRVLLQAITSHNIGGRLLGATKTIERPNRFNWIATGNNPMVYSEMQRRIVPVRLNAKTDDIQSRKYRHKNYLEFLKRERPRIVHAILVLIQNWIDSGMPLFEERKRASFEDWSAKVGGVLMCAGVEGFLDNGMPPTADMDEAAVKMFVRVWLTRFGKENPMTMAELFAYAMETELDIADGNNDDMKKSRFQKRLPAMDGRTFNIDGKLFMVRTGFDEDHVTTYRLVTVEMEQA